MTAIRSTGWAAAMRAVQVRTQMKNGLGVWGVCLEKQTTAYFFARPLQPERVSDSSGQLDTADIEAYRKDLGPSKEDLGCCRDRVHRLRQLMCARRQAFCA